MSSPLSSAEQHQQGQAALVDAMLEALFAAWGLLDVTRMAATLPAFTAAVRAVVVRYGQAAASAALTHFRVERAAAGVTVPFRPKTPLPVAVDLIESAVNYATADLWRPPAGQIGPWVPDVPAAQQTLEAEASKLVLDQQRDATLTAVKQDRAATGWARIPHPDESLSGTCAFCLMLASRGATYRRKSSANFRAHVGCHCTAEAEFKGQKVTTLTIKAAQKLWTESTKGLSGNEARKAFRRAVEERRTGREVTPRSLPAAPKPVTVPPEAAQALIGKFEKSIATMRRNNKNGSLDKTIRATEQRINALRDALPVAA